jgi:hypothetical protein
LPLQLPHLLMTGVPSGEQIGGFFQRCGGLVRPRISPEGLKAKITDAFLRSAETDARRVRVEVQGSKVILRGRVYSLAEKQEAARAAWSAPGVSAVDNQIVVLRRKPLWFWVTILIVVFALLFVTVAFPLLLMYR